MAETPGLDGRGGRRRTCGITVIDVEGKQAYGTRCRNKSCSYCARYHARARLSQLQVEGIDRYHKVPEYAWTLYRDMLRKNKVRYMAIPQSNSGKRIVFSRIGSEALPDDYEQQLDVMAEMIMHSAFTRISTRPPSGFGGVQNSRGKGGGVSKQADEFLRVNESLGKVAERLIALHESSTGEEDQDIADSLRQQLQEYNDDLRTVLHLDGVSKQLLWMLYGR